MNLESRGLSPPENSIGVQDLFSMHSLSPAVGLKRFGTDLTIAIPFFQGKDLSIAVHGASAWAKAYKVDVKVDGDLAGSFFMKVSTGWHQCEIHYWSF